MWTNARLSYESEHPEARKCSLEIPPGGFYRTPAQQDAWDVLHNTSDEAEAQHEAHRQQVLELTRANAPKTPVVGAPPAQQAMDDPVQPGAPSSPAVHASTASASQVALINVQPSTSPASAYSSNQDGSTTDGAIASVEGQPEGTSGAGEQKFGRQCSTAYPSHAKFCMACGQTL